MPSGAASTAARRRLVLNEPSRRLPETARIRIVSSPASRERARPSARPRRRGSCRRSGSARSRRSPNVVAVDRRLEREPRRSRPNGSTLGADAKPALQLDRLRDALHRQLAASGRASPSSRPKARRRGSRSPEAARRRRSRATGGGRPAARPSRRRSRPRRACEGRALERGVEVAEAAAEGVDAGVLDLERDVRVDRVGAQVVPAGAMVVVSRVLI